MLTREQVLRIAQLARLGLRDDEIEKLQTQLSGILAYVDKKKALIKGLVKKYLLS